MIFALTTLGGPNGGGKERHDGRLSWALLLPVVLVVGVVAVIALFGLGVPGLEAPSGEAVVAPGPVVRYSQARLVAGLSLASLMLAGAVWLIATTDWSRPEGDPFEE